MKQIRFGVFETNSSSTHSLTIVSEEDFEKWEKGELIFKRWTDEFIEPSKEYDDNYDLQTYDAWKNQDMETYTQHYVTKSGDKIVAFGHFGYNG